MVDTLSVLARLDQPPPVLAGIIAEGARLAGDHRNWARLAARPSCPPGVVANAARSGVAVVVAAAAANPTCPDEPIIALAAELVADFSGGQFPTGKPSGPGDADRWEILCGVLLGAAGRPALLDSYRELLDAVCDADFGGSSGSNPHAYAARSVTDTSVPSEITVAVLARIAAKHPWTRRGRPFAGAWGYPGNSVMGAIWARGDVASELVAVLPAGHLPALLLAHRDRLDDRDWALAWDRLVAGPASSWDRSLPFDVATALAETSTLWPDHYVRLARGILATCGPLGDTGTLARLYHPDGIGGFDPDELAAIINSTSVGHEDGRRPAVAGFDAKIAAAAHPNCPAWIASRVAGEFALPDEERARILLGHQHEPDFIRDLLTANPGHAKTVAGYAATGYLNADIAYSAIAAAATSRARDAQRHTNDEDDDLEAVTVLLSYGGPDTWDRIRWNDAGAAFDQHAPALTWLCDRLCELPPAAAETLAGLSAELGDRPVSEVLDLCRAVSS